MKLATIALTLSVISPPLSTCVAATTVDATNKYAYGANVGWMDWRGDTNNGAVIGEYVCSGSIYAANVGWISLGSANPANQIQYQNNSATDFGVNHDGTGRLTGYAYGANIGWINFEQTYGQPKVDLYSGKLSGSVWSANCGWISLSNAVTFVQTDAIPKGPLAPNGLPVAWLVQYFGTTNVNPNADVDGDGAANASEYAAGTVPTNAASVLKITSFTRGSPTPTYTTLRWNAVNTRCYAVQARPSLTTGAWVDVATFNFLGWDNAAFDDYSTTNEFHRIRAYRPLTP